MNVRRTRGRELYQIKKTGAFSRFATPNSTVIESILTSFDINELSWLSYARDVSSTLDFDLLVQRDIDEERALQDISEYIFSESHQVKNPVFLPPLIAAIVSTDLEKKLENFYPRQIFHEESDNYGVCYRRTWAPHFQVTHYESETGRPLSINAEEIDPERQLLISTSETEIGITLTEQNNPGAKLVVIDGQHRLFALNSLKEHHRKEVEDLLIPVLIVYAPDSTTVNPDADRDSDTQTVPDVYRKLFVDVNSTAHLVSGHFVILLSDNTLGSMVCRSFCHAILNMDEGSDKGKESLAQIEWNTRNDKESKTISKLYTLTSIGVLNDSLNDVFKQRKESELLRYMLNIGDSDFPFEDEDGNLKPEPREFPWQGFLFKHKDDLRNLVRDNFVPCLLEIFFESEPYSELRKVFEEAYSKVVTNEINKRGPRFNAARVVKEHLLDSRPCSGATEGALLAEFNNKFEDLAKGRFLEIIRTSVFQKGMLTAWLEFQRAGRKSNLKPIDTTKGFVCLLNKVLNTGLFENDAKHLYLQDSIYESVRIRPTVECRKQILRLILSLLGEDKVRYEVIERIKKFDEFDETDLSERLQLMGISFASQFLGSLKDKRIKNFERNFKADTSLDDVLRDQLNKLLEEKEEAKRRKRTDKSVEIPVAFDKLVEKETKIEFDISQQQLENILGFSTVGESETEDIEED